MRKKKSLTDKYFFSPVLFSSLFLLPSERPVSCRQATFRGIGKREKKSETLLKEGDRDTNSSSSAGISGFGRCIFSLIPKDTFPFSL